MCVLAEWSKVLAAYAELCISGVSRQTRGNQHTLIPISARHTHSSAIWPHKDKQCMNCRSEHSRMLPTVAAVHNALFLYWDGLLGEGLHARLAR